MKILIVEPGKNAYPAEIKGDLHEMQQIVGGGPIQALYPWTDKAALVCNEEGEIMELPSNRLLKDIGIIDGPFFICGIEGANFVSLTNQQMVFYKNKFLHPELFFNTRHGIVVKRCSEKTYADVQRSLEHGSAHRKNKDDHTK